MLCVRVTPMLRRRVKLAAAVSGRSIQAIATDALEQACRQCDM
jgi:predicted HicB family RNase H-like nuclease